MKDKEIKELCTGCSACASICPQECILMKKNNEGFLYPEVSKECVNCGLCKTVCPILNLNLLSRRIIPRAFAARTKSQRVWERSSSGGAFSEICNTWADEETLICGAAWDGFDVKHVCVIGKEKINPLCKSKYIASDVNDSYNNIKKHLFPSELVQTKSFLLLPQIS